MIKVVIADDDVQVSRFEGRVMSSMGCAPILCRDGLRALAVLEDNPDTRLLITDISMPNMDGRDLVLELRRHPAYERLPIILTSGVVRVAEISDLLDIGVTCFLGKPVGIRDLKWYARNLMESNVGALVT